jgi:hypothetical protein
MTEKSSFKGLKVEKREDAQSLPHGRRIPLYPSFTQRAYRPVSVLLLSIPVAQRVHRREIHKNSEQHEYERVSCP